VSPADAAIFSGERQLATGTATLSLPAAQQVLTVRRKGYAEETLRVTPRPGFPQAFNVRLKTLAQKEEAATRTQLRTAAGQELALMRPGSFRMGSSRRESGRRANEAMREIRLTRPYYLSVTEVSNAEFRQFRPAHSSGNFKGKSLNGDTQPATNLGWTDAALYCNWLSARENLKPFYRVSGKAVTGIDPTATGYRLPTEAEWAWAATLTTDGNLLRFPWGAALPPGPKAGNYADKSGESILGEIIAGYDDGFPVSAPVRSFAPNRLGLFDLGGNAAEWVHDIYDAAPPGSGVETDPFGADIGEYHVIRGASWRHGGLTELRLAFRDYGSEARADAGFRIARYLK
jgi:formylglycine-generating enzyme required for sulfatase activity